MYAIVRDLIDSCIANTPDVWDYAKNGVAVCGGVMIKWAPRGSNSAACNRCNRLRRCDDQAGAARFEPAIFNGSK